MIANAVAVENILFIYTRVAINFASRIKEVFASEDTMKAYFADTFKHLEFSRTDHWRGLLGKMLTDVWFEHGPEVRAVPTPHDQEKILERLYFDNLLDYNLFTQVMLNLQRYIGFAYNVGEAKKQLETMQAFYKDKKVSPFTPKATMIKNATKFDELRYNNDLSSIKALHTIEKFGLTNSYRVSPMGSTPAFADSLNASMIGAGGDKYLVTLPGLRVMFLSWTSSPIMTEVEPDGSFKAKGIFYPFYSKSGGEILNEVLFSRWVAHFMYGVLASAKTKVILPRMNSTQIVTEAPINDQEHNPVKSALEEIKNLYPSSSLVFSYDERPQN
jgi:hypothetical protein